MQFWRVGHLLLANDRLPIGQRHRRPFGRQETIDEEVTREARLPITLAPSKYKSSRPSLPTSPVARFFAAGRSFAGGRFRAAAVAFALAFGADPSSGVFDGAAFAFGAASASSAAAARPAPRSLQGPFQKEGRKSRIVAKPVGPSPAEH